MGFNRREILLAGSTLALGLASSSLLETKPSRPSRFRLGHLTDVHLRPGATEEKKFAQALEHAQSQGIDLLINGGDAIFDALATDRSAVEAQWRVWNRLLSRHCRVDVVHVVGNHDIYGWATPERNPGTKAGTLEQLGLEKSYYSLERGGWKLIVLDSIHWGDKRPSGYVALLGKQQLLWLESQLGETSLPVCVISHIPILAGCAFLDGMNETTGNWRVPGEWMHLDARAIKSLFAKHPQVKLCLSGHSHLVDRLDYLGVSYFCNGAVCGDYWKGPCQEFEPSYATVDLFEDGTFEVRRHLYEV